MRALAIVNPAAGAGRARGVWSRIAPALGSDVGVAMTTRPGHARQVAFEALGQSLERVIAVGGDGTISEVAGALAGTPTPLGIVPAGTGNDVSATLGLPADPLAALHVALGSSMVRLIDVGRMQHTHGQVAFVNVAGFGFDAEIVRRLQPAPRRQPTPRLPHVPRLPLGGAMLPYVVGVLRTLAVARLRPVRLLVDGALVERSVLLVAVANGPRYAGGMLIAPDARLDDGWLDVCVVGDLRRGEIVRLLPAMRRGGHRRHPKVTFFRCRELRAACVDAADELHCQVDGELVGQLPATFCITPAALRCVVPGRGR